MADLDPFAVLGIDRSADGAIVRAAYRLCALQAHPDRMGASSTARMKSVTAAYALLTDPKARAAWEAGHPAVVSAGKARGSPDQCCAASAYRDGPRTGCVARQRLAGRHLQWVAAIVLVVAVLAVSILGGPVATTVASLALGLIWLADQVPDPAPFWPARDCFAAARATARGCAGMTSALVLALMQRGLR